MTVSLASNWAALPDDALTQIMGFYPDSARVLGPVCHRYQRFSREILRENLDRTFAQCSTVDSSLCRRVRQLEPSYREGVRAILEFQSLFVRGIEFQVSESVRQNMSANLCVMAHASVNNIISSLRGESCSDEILVPTQVVSCHDQIQEGQDRSLQILWQKIRYGIFNAMALAIGGDEVPEYDAPVQQVRREMRAEDCQPFLGEIDTLHLDRLDLLCLPLEMEVFTGVTALCLRDNHLHFLPSGVFDGMTRLKVLHLDFNHLASLPFGLFKNLGHLEQLYLGDNVFSALPSGMLHGLTSLRGLHLKNNRLRTLSFDLFDETPGLRALDISQNQMTSIPRHLWNRLPRLQCLLIDRNNADSLPPALAQKLRRQNKLMLIDGPPSGVEETRERATLFFNSCS